MLFFLTVAGRRPNGLRFWIVGVPLCGRHRHYGRFLGLVDSPQPIALRILLLRGSTTEPHLDFIFPIPRAVGCRYPSLGFKAKGFKDLFYRMSECLCGSFDVVVARLGRSFRVRLCKMRVSLWRIPTPRFPFIPRDL